MIARQYPNLKNYTHYRKAEEPYFNLSELLFFPVTPLAVVAVVSYILLFFLGLFPTIVVNVIAAIVANTIYLGLRNFSPNGGTRRKTDFVETLPTFFIILGLEFIINVGVYIVVTYQKTGVFYGWFFYGWLFVVLGIPILYFLTRHLAYLHLLGFQNRCFKSLYLSVAYDAELQVYIEKIAFLNTKKKLAGQPYIDGHVVLPYPEQLKAMSLEDRNRYLYGRIFSETIYIPIDTDRLVLSWYSLTENIYYQDEIEFPYSKLFYEENNHTPNTRIKPITLSIREEGRIGLYSREGTIIEPVTFKGVPADESKKRKVLGFTTYEWLQKKSDNNHVLLEQVKRRSRLSGFVCNWQLTGHGLERHDTEVDLVQTYEDFGRTIVPDTFVKRPLPIQIELSYDRYSWAIFYIDPEQLYELLQATGHTGSDISIEVNLDIEQGEASLSIKSGDVLLPFTAFEKKIAPHSLEVVQGKFQKEKKEKKKHELPVRIYELLQQQAYSEAQTLCTSGLEQYPDFLLLYFYEARILWYTQGYEASYAKESYFIAKTHEDAFALGRIYNHYGCLLDEQNRYREALSYFEKAAATHPKEVIYQSNIAEMYYRMQDTKQALHYADECTRRGHTSDIISEILALRG